MADTLSESLRSDATGLTQRVKSSSHSIIPKESDDIEINLDNADLDPLSDSQLDTLLKDFRSDDLDNILCEETENINPLTMTMNISILDK